MLECLRAAGAKMPDITDENKNELLLRYARNGAAPLVRVLLDAGANVAHTNEKDLEFDSAANALSGLTIAQFREVSTFSRPPRMAGIVMEAVCILFGAKTTWEDSKKLLKDSNLIFELVTFDKDNISEKILKALKKYIENPDFVPKNAGKASFACEALCMWCWAIFIHGFFPH